MGRVLRAEGMASAKALKLDCAWHTWRAKVVGSKEDQILVSFTAAHGRCGQAIFLPLRSQSNWPWKLMPWTATRNSCSRKVRPGEGMPRSTLRCPALPYPAHLFLPATEKLVEAKLEDVKHRLCSQFGAKGCSTITEGLFLRSQEAAAVV